MLTVALLAWLGVAHAETGGTGAAIVDTASGDTGKPPAGDTGATGADTGGADTGGSPALGGSGSGSGTATGSGSGARDTGSGPTDTGTPSTAAGIAGEIGGVRCDHLGEAPNPIGLVGPLSWLLLRRVRS